MTAIDSAPTNKNFLSPVSFKFLIKKAPGVNFFIQKVTVPRMTLPAVDTPNPFVNLPKPGDHIDFDTLSITFKVDEDLQNYMELYNWIVQMGKPQSFDQYKYIQDKDPMSGEGIYSDIELDILNSRRSANYAVVFQDAYPIELGDITFDTTLEDIDYVTASAVFKYKLYTIEKI